MSDTDTMDIPEAEESTGILISLKAGTSEGETLVAEWNATFSPPYSHYPIQTPDEFYGFSDTPPRLTYPGLLVRVPQALEAFLYAEEASEQYISIWVKWKENDIGCHASEGYQPARQPYIELSLFQSESERDAAVEKLKAMGFLANYPECIWGAVDVELAESYALEGPMTA